ncbi:MAG: DUF5908 family protein [Bacteroidia bacterium]
MPIEIKELLIRAFVNEAPSEDNPEPVPPIVEKANSAQDMLSMVANMLQKEKER